jgi:hypothetical protein
LSLNGVKSSSIWLEERPLDAKEEFEADLTRGTHAMTFKIDMGAGGAALRLELRDRRNLTARLPAAWTEFRSPPSVETLFTVLPETTRKGFIFSHRKRRSRRQRFRPRGRKMQHL